MVYIPLYDRLLIKTLVKFMAFKYNKSLISCSKVQHFHLLFVVITHTCFLDNTNIDPGRNDLKKFGNVSMPSECQEKCKDKIECKSFVWHFRLDCWLKTVPFEDALFEMLANSVTGPRECGKTLYTHMHRCKVFFTLQDLII